jgi:hypothetical protein
MSRLGSVELNRLRVSEDIRTQIPLLRPVPTCPSAVSVFTVSLESRRGWWNSAKGVGTARRRPQIRKGGWHDGTDAQSQCPAFFFIQAPVLEKARPNRDSNTNVRLLPAQALDILVHSRLRTSTSLDNALVFLILGCAGRDVLSVRRCLGLQGANRGT